MLRYLIDLELSFVQGGKYESIRIILNEANLFNLHHLFKKHSFFQCVFMTSLSNQVSIDIKVSMGVTPIKTLRVQKDLL